MGMSKADRKRYGVITTGPTKGAIPGTRGYDPSAVPTPKAVPGYGSLDRSRLSPLQSYASPVATEAPGVTHAPRPESATSLAEQQQRQEENPWANGFVSPTWDHPDQWAADSANEDVTGKQLPEKPKPKPEPYKNRHSYELTWDEYQKLNDSQRAAVDFNTMLVQAREKDLKLDYDEVSEEQKAAYREDIRAMFGEGKGTETFAPETLSVLKQVDFKATDEDIDDFLGLKNTVNLRELGEFDARPANQSVLYADGDVQAKGAYTGKAQLAHNTERLAKQMMQADQVKQSFLAAAATQRNDLLSRYGGQPNEIRPGLGFGTAEDRKPTTRGQGVDEFFRSAFEALAFKGEVHDPEYVEKTWSMIQNEFGNPKKDAQQLARYIDLRTRQALDTGTKLGGAGFRDPAELRDLLGLDRGGD